MRFSDVFVPAPRAGFPNGPTGVTTTGAGRGLEFTIVRQAAGEILAAESPLESAWVLQIGRAHV